MAKKTLQINLLMLLVAMIWGSALVAQRMGMDSTGPLLFSGLRFAMGALVILPFLLYRRHAGIVQLPFFAPRLLAGGMLLGVLVTAGINLQQTGLLLTSVSHAGFITGMYVLMVPLLGLLIGHHPAAGTWLGALLALAGLYLLSVEDGLRIASGDWLQLAGAFCWALHVLLMGHLAKKHDPLRLALIQFVTCAVISLLAALLLEPVSWSGILGAGPALLYAGVLSVGVGFSLQAIALQHARPAHAAIILSMEGVFAAVAAALWLGESLPLRGYAGAALMVAGMLLAQLWPQSRSSASSAGSLPMPLDTPDGTRSIVPPAECAPAPGSAESSRPGNAG